MNSEMQQIYSLVLPAAPYVIAAYGILWAALVVYIGFVLRRLGRVQRELAVVEESVERRSAQA